MLADRLDDGLSAVYSFFDPALDRRSPGTFMILAMVEEARRLGLPHVYLGYWIAESRKMAYKARFRPLEALVDGTWRDLDD
jgi:arginine-tRNA-protein transferase